jgi:phosphatidylserine/phosphatidylglycerophosphate/cardiolipin synthase-like enzyme
MLSGATDVAAIAALVESCPQTLVRFLPSLHAKIYISDTRQAVVTSANLTENGLSRNLEYGVLFNDPADVKRIRADLLRYGDLGSPIALPQLRAFAEAAEDLRSTRAKAERSLRRSLRIEFDKKLQAMQVDVLRTRAAGRSLDAIFSEAILYLLSERDMTTRELNASVQRIHPDLCDDTVNRVIGGRAFGKKWKHSLRTAQAHLKEAGQIARQGNQWTITK